MSWIWVKLITGIVFVLVPGFALNENYKKHPYLTVFSIFLGFFLLFLSIKPLVEANTEVDTIKSRIEKIEKERIARDFIEKKKLDKDKLDKDKLDKDKQGITTSIKQAGIVKNNNKTEFFSDKNKRKRLPDTPVLIYNLLDTEDCIGSTEYVLQIKKYKTNEKKLAELLRDRWSENELVAFQVSEVRGGNPKILTGYIVAAYGFQYPKHALKIYKRMLKKADMKDDFSEAFINSYCLQNAKYQYF